MRVKAEGRGDLLDAVAKDSQAADLEVRPIEVRQLRDPPRVLRGQEDRHPPAEDALPSLRPDPTLVQELLGGVVAGRNNDIGAALPRHLEGAGWNGNRMHPYLVPRLSDEGGRGLADGRLELVWNAEVNCCSTYGHAENGDAQTQAECQRCSGPHLFPPMSELVSAGALRSSSQLPPSVSTR